MHETEILDFAETKFYTIEDTATIDEAVNLMSSSVQSELIVTNGKGEFRGKLSSLSLFNKAGQISQVGVLDEECMIIEHDASLQKAMEIASSFVGEIIPIIDKQTNKAVAVITEGAIFQAYLSKQSQTVEMERR